MLIQESVPSSGDADIDAFHRLDNGHFLISIEQNHRVIGGLDVSDRDIIEYDPGANTATRRLAESSWGQGVEVDGVSQLGNRRFITVANHGSRRLGGGVDLDGLSGRRRVQPATRPDRRHSGRCLRRRPPKG